MRSQIFRQIAQKFRRHTVCMARDFWVIWRKICTQITCKAVRRALCSVSWSVSRIFAACCKKHVKGIQKFQGGTAQGFYTRCPWAIPHKDCATDACEKIRNRLWREICKQMACKVARRFLCGIALGIFPDMPAYTVHEVIFVAFSNLQTLLRQSSSSRQFLLSLPVGIQLRLHERSQFIHTQQELRRHAAFLQQVQRLYSVLP